MVDLTILTFYKWRPLFRKGCSLLSIWSLSKTGATLKGKNLLPSGANSFLLELPPPLSEKGGIHFHVSYSSSISRTYLRTVSILHLYRSAVKTTTKKTQPKTTTTTTKKSKKQQPKNKTFWPYRAKKCFWAYAKCADTIMRMRKLSIFAVLWYI